MKLDTFYIVTPANLSAPEWDALHLRFMAPWHPEDLRLVKIFIALRRKRNLKIRWERVAQFNRHTCPEYFLEHDRWLGVMRQVQQEVDALVLPVYSWETLQDTLEDKRARERLKKQRWRLKKRQLQIEYTRSQAPVDIDP